jgi:hypothetical protein
MLSFYLRLDYFRICCSCGWGETVSELRPPTILLLIPHVTYEYGELRWDDIGRENRRTRNKTCPSATLSTANPTCTDSGANPGFCDEMPATDRLSHATALDCVTKCVRVGGHWFWFKNIHDPYKRRLLCAEDLITATWWQLMNPAEPVGTAVTRVTRVMEDSGSNPG